jgi:DNA-directed RNA polymerase I, II, and III subunit RPABC2
MADTTNANANANDQQEEPEVFDEATGKAMDTVTALGISEPPSAKTQQLLDHHPEIYPDYEDSVQEKLLVRGTLPPVNDPNHRTYPYITLYERTKILSLRASQLEHGAQPFIEVPPHISKSYEIAEAELEAKKLPFILKRPLPNGEYEYWRLSDLMIL